MIKKRLVEKAAAAAKRDEVAVRWGEGWGRLLTQCYIFANLQPLILAHVRPRNDSCRTAEMAAHFYSIWKNYFCVRCTTRGHLYPVSYL